MNTIYCKTGRSGGFCLVLGVGAALSLHLSSAAAVTFDANWISQAGVITVGDSVTSDNRIGSGWTIDDNADSWSNDYYERPTAQSTTGTSGDNRIYSFVYQNLDITSGNYWIDTTNQFVYFRINLFGTLQGPASDIDQNKDSKPLDYDYRVLLNDGTSMTGGYLLNATQPGSKLTSSFAGNSELYIYRDANNDIGTDGNGFESGGNASSSILQARRDANGLWIDFALDYGELDSSLDLATYILRFEATKGLQDRSNYLWNDEYTLSQAGSPYLASYGADGSDSNVGNISELDTTRWEMSSTPAPVPLPAAAWLLISGLGGLAIVGRRRRATT